MYSKYKYWVIFKVNVLAHTFLEFQFLNWHVWSLSVQHWSIRPHPCQKCEFKVGQCFLLISAKIPLLTIFKHQFYLVITSKVNSFVFYTSQHIKEAMFCQKSRLFKDTLAWIDYGVPTIRSSICNMPLSRSTNSYEANNVDQLAKQAFQWDLNSKVHTSFFLNFLSKGSCLYRLNDTAKFLAWVFRISLASFSCFENVEINRDFWFDDQFSLYNSPFQKLDKIVFLSGQMCHRKTPGQIRHADKTVPYCQLMGAKSKLRWLYLRKLILRLTGHPLGNILTADFSVTNQILFASQNPK